MKTTKFKKHLSEDEHHKERESKTKKVMIDNLEMPAAGSLVPLTPYERLQQEFDKVLDTRSKLTVSEKIGNEIVDLTPPQLQVSKEMDGFIDLLSRYESMQVGDAELVSFKSITSSTLRHRISRGMGLHVSLEDVTKGIGTDRIQLDKPTTTNLRSSSLKTILDSSCSLLSEATATEEQKHGMPFIRIILRKTDLILLYEQHGVTSIKNTEDGKFVEMDNKEYDYLTIGRGKIRRRSDGEAQTAQTLFKSRDVNTERKQTQDVASFVSNYEMFDTYKMLDANENEEAPRKSHISHGKTPEEQFNIIVRLPSFQLASVVMRRLLAGNIYEEGQRRFRNMSKVARTANKISYKYSLKILFTINPSLKDNERRAAADICFCPTNSDILAVAYGIYSYQAAKLPSSGEVCIWSIKNPCDPERFYSYSVPVVSLEFSPFLPTLLAIGLFDGSVEVRDITYFNQPPVAISKRTSTPGVDPVLAIRWIKQKTSSGSDEIDPFLALSQDGSVTQFRIINSPILSSFKLINLQRLEGAPEGLPGIKISAKIIQHSNRYPQGLNLIKHPVELDIYYILTDEGCIHKCSTNYQHHYLQALRTHEGSVNYMDFSPWSPKLFLTCGNDWCVRIWMDGIHEPLLTLKNLYQPYNWAAWSRTNSTILVAANRSHCEIWDLTRNILKPMSATEFNNSNNTTGIFSLDGYSVLIGNERGQVLVNALDDMPFPPYYQYEALEKAIYKAVSNNPDLFMELKGVGYFGYPNKGFVKSS